MSDRSGPHAAGADRRIGVLTTDVDLVVKSWDAVLEGMTGIPASVACGRRLTDLVPDLTTRVPLALLLEPLVSGSVQILAPALHQYLIPCPPPESSVEFDHMQQRVIVGALRCESGTAGLVVTIEDVTARLESERSIGRQLREGSSAERVLAAARLVQFDPVDGLGPVETALRDDDWQVRRAAVRALASRRDATLVDAVVNALRDGHRNFSLLSSALELLSTTGVDVTDALVSLMRHDDADLRTQAALALGGQRRPEAIAALIAALDDPDANVRFHAIEAMGKLAHPGAIERLGEIATSGDFFLAFPAIEALVQIGDPLAAPSLSTLLNDTTLSSAAAEALGILGGEDAVASLVRALDGPHSAVESIVDAVVRIHRRYTSLFGGAEEIEDQARRAISREGVRRVSEALAGASGVPLKHLVTVFTWIHDAESPAALARLLGSSGVRHEVIEALVRCGSSAVDVLIEQLRTDDVDAKRAAVVALGRLGDGRAAPALIELLTDEAERDSWAVVAAALARLGDRRAFEPLLRRLDDPDVAIRHGAVEALNSIGDPAMQERIVPMIGGSSPFARESAVRIAGYFGYANCLQGLFECCRDDDESVRCAAIEHLPYFDDSRVLAALALALSEGTPRMRASAAKALGSVTEPAASRLLMQALQDEEPWVRYFAAMSLGRHRDPSSLRALAARASGDTAMQVAVAATDAVAAIGTHEALSALGVVAAATEERGLAALRALGRIRSEEAIEHLKIALKSQDPLRRFACVEALVTHGSAEATEVLAWTAIADSDANAARAAIAGLGVIANRNAPGSARAVRALVETLREPTHRADALDALAHVASGALLELTQALAADDPMVRRGVVEALSRLSHPVASACLRRALTDADAVVRRTAIAALSRVGSRGLGTQLAALASGDPSPAVRQTAAMALHRSDATEGTE